MKFLIVNADDFGYSHGVNQGIIRAHTDGIVTSTSVLVDSAAAKEANTLLKYPKLSVGLHFSIADRESRLVWLEGTFKSFFKNRLQAEFDRQIKKFIEIVGKLPDHLDSHYHIHIHPRVKPIFVEYSKKHSIPVRAFGNAYFIDKFYGQNKLTKRTYLKGINVENLLKILTNLKDGFSELMCHPGFVDDDLRKISSYADEREEELKTLMDPRIAQFIKQNSIKLTNWKDIILR